jgi:hypothetical protein
MAPRFARTLAPMSRLDRKISLSRRAANASLSATAACLVAGSALAGDALDGKPPMAAAINSRCNARGDGSFALAGSSACVKISGYVAAGADFGDVAPAAPRNSNLLDVTPPEPVRTLSGISAEARFEPPMAPTPVYVPLGRERRQP